MQAQALETLAPDARKRFDYQCPADHAFLHSWDAEVDGNVVLLVVSERQDGFSLHARNAGEREESFTLSYACGDAAFGGEAFKRKIERIPAEAGTRG